MTSFSCSGYHPAPLKGSRSSVNDRLANEGDQKHNNSRDVRFQSEIGTGCDPGTHAARIVEVHIKDIALIQLRYSIMIIKVGTKFRKAERYIVALKQQLRIPTSKSCKSGATKILANLIVMGGGILARALVQAYRQALQNASKTGVAQETLQNAVRKGSKAMTEQEARQILGVSEQSSWEEIAKASI
ncbi:mitochondrial import inner membrane translocase subunit PAM16 like protein [Tanacetum coccineum]